MTVPRPVKNLSHSAINDFKWCPLLWYGRRVAKWTETIPEGQRKAMDLGTAIHAGLGAYHTGGDIEEAMVKTFFKVKLPPPEQTTAYRVVQKYQAQFDPLPGVAEFRFMMPIPGVPVPYIGFIDLLTEDGIIDWKSTSGNSWVQGKADKEAQATAYWRAFQLVKKKVPSWFTYRIILLNGETFQDLSTERDDQAVSGFVSDAQSIYEQMRTGELEAKCGDSCTFPTQCEAVIGRPLVPRLGGLSRPSSSESSS